MNTYKMITLDDTITQVEGNICSDMAGEKVMLNVSAGKYFNLGETGGDIWDLIQEPVTVRVVIEKMMNLYEVEREQCKTQVVSFLDNLLEQGLIKKIVSEK